MAITVAMVIAAGIVTFRTARQPRVAETVSKDILPGTVILFAFLLVGYAVLLRPLGFCRHPPCSLLPR